MKFYNRKKELANFKKTRALSNKTGAQFSVILGPRRIGKSELMRQAAAGTKHIYFFVSQKRSPLLLNEFTSILNRKFNLKGEYPSWDLFFEVLFEQAIKNKTTIIFDEFQNFNYLKGEDIFGTIQKYWDENHHQKGLNIATAGSFVSLLEKIFYSSKNPLYGRSTAKLFLRQLSFKTVYQILKDNRKNATFKDLLAFYTIFGGYPYYYYIIFQKNLFNQRIIEIIKHSFLLNDTPLKEEGRDILIREFASEHVSYFAVLDAIATNRKSFNKIKSYTQTTDSFLYKALDDLENKFRLIKKSQPLFSSTKNNPRYKLNNNFLKFWFRYIYNQISATETEDKAFIIEKISEELNTLNGHTFEQFCFEFFALNKNSFVYPIESIGKYWDKTGEIDLVIDNSKLKKCLFVECKLSSKSLNREMIKNLINKAEKVDALKSRKKIYLFAFADKVSAKNKQLLSRYNIACLDLDNFMEYLDAKRKFE